MLIVTNGHPGFDVLVGGVQGNAWLAVPDNIRLVTGPPGPPRIEWLEPEWESRTSANSGAMGSQDIERCINEFCRLADVSTPDKAIISFVQRYGPVRIEQDGQPGRPGARGLGSAQRSWETVEEQESWSLEMHDVQVSASDNEFADVLIDVALDEAVGRRGTPRWEPIAAYRRYAGVLRVLQEEAHALSLAPLTLPGSRLPSVDVSWERFIRVGCATFTPRFGVDVPVGAGSLVMPPATVLVAHPSGPNRDVADPSAWDVPSWQVSGWRAVWESVAPLAPDRTCLWALQRRRELLTRAALFLTKTANLALQLDWPMVTEPAVPTLTLAPQAINEANPYELPLSPEARPWPLWSLLVVQWLEAIASPNGYLRCANCLRPFPKVGGTRAPRGEDMPSYCSEDCRYEKRKEAYRQRYAEGRIKGRGPTGKGVPAPAVKGKPPRKRGSKRAPDPGN